MKDLDLFVFPFNKSYFILIHKVNTRSVNTQTNTSFRQHSSYVLFLTEACLLLMWTSYINCVSVRNVLLRSCCGFGSMFNLAALGAITFFYTGDRQTRRLDPFISFVRGNVSFLLWCVNELGETLWAQFWSLCLPHVDSFTKSGLSRRLKYV